MAQTTTSTVSYDTTAYNMQAYFALRPQLHYDDLATVKTTPQTHTGASVAFTITSDLAAATTPLTETSDVTPVALSDSQVTLTLAEQGNVVETTAKVINTSFIAYNPIVANAVGFNAGISLDSLALTSLSAGTNVYYGSASAGPRGSVVAANVLTSQNVQAARAQLINNNVMPYEDGLYRAVIHPYQEYDLKQQTGEVGWRYPQSNNSNLSMGIVGGAIATYEGFDFRINSRANVRVNAGGGSVVDIYDALFMGQEALAKAYSTGTHGNGQTLGPAPIVFPGPFLDNLYRFRKMAWYWFGAYGIFRQAALIRYETASSLANNVS